MLLQGGTIQEARAKGSRRVATAPRSTSSFSDQSQTLDPSCGRRQTARNETTRHDKHQDTTYPPTATTKIVNDTKLHDDDDDDKSDSKA